MTRKIALQLGMLTLWAFCMSSAMGSGCAVDPGTLTEDDCGSAKSVCFQKTLQPGLINGQSDYFELETPEARNDCHALYHFRFRWADPIRQILDKDMPPLDNLARAFQPGGEFAYFPHDPPSGPVDSAETDCNNIVQSTGGWWMITFSTGNQNSSLPTTRYYVGTRLDPARATSDDATEVVCVIQYYDKPKK